MMAWFWVRTEALELWREPLALQKPTLIPVVHVSSRGTDDILTVAGLKPEKMFGALIMPNDYLGELYDVDNSGYNWGE